MVKFGGNVFQIKKYKTHLVDTLFQGSHAQIIVINLWSKIQAQDILHTSSNWHYVNSHEILLTCTKSSGFYLTVYQLGSTKTPNCKYDLSNCVHVCPVQLYSIRQYTALNIN